MIKLNLAKQMGRTLVKEIVSELRETRQELREFYLWNS